MADVNTSKHIRNIPLDLILSVLTCFLYNAYVNAKQMDALNDMLKTQKYLFWEWVLYSLLTCGLYHIYHEYRMGKDLQELCQEKNDTLIIVSIVLLCLGFTPVVDALQQSQINKFYGNRSL